MLKQYSILTKCLAELKRSDLPLIEKLKLEVQLIQTKRMLLDQKIEYRVSGVASSERDFIDLYDQIRRACSCGRGEGEVEQIKAHIAEIKESLNFKVRAPSHNLLQLFR
jgi:DNA-binding FadR family transcriptional regulator